MSDKRRLLRLYSSLADSGHGVFLTFCYFCGPISSFSCSVMGITIYLKMYIYIYYIMLLYIFKCSVSILLIFSSLK
jgi:hypothetical protein